MSEENNKTSIIVVAYDTIRLQRWVTSACLGNIARYTDRDDYELIFVDQSPKGKSAGALNERHHCIDIDKHIKVDGNIGASAAANLGAKSATGKYICFLHNDVFVWEGWLSTLRSFIEKDICEIVIPHQGASTREHVKQFYKNKMEDSRGNDDAGLVMMTRETFNKTGGWDERIKSIYPELAFRRRWVGRSYCTSKVLITHICCGTLWAWSNEEEQAAYAEEAPIINNPNLEKINYLK